MYEEALEYIKSCEEGVLQSDLWKCLDIDSRKCSRIVSKLLREDLIRREPESADGVRTFRLWYAGTKPAGGRFASLLVGEIFEPCGGCINECVPEHCPELSEWIFAIVLEEGADLTIDGSTKKATTSLLQQ
ncbi:Lrp/AsnC family transcriptional regulator [Methanotrichaceae archaeon M04Ac]|uniref:Lrp/AsnC family transcriptional regulator n=1 Tax=Candidatus Methanocrinis alkalitolerans TaxID=3033395 RepID=A0ABT5XF24_9EURY|nr:Lrp/AsnC family transcriptional regulator [Candidatus Methanocrinis alkalitolerans]MCR3883616.1 MarR family transcriptional regulator [Methanothrix sp.]MDF0593319.1 Lrp/AsnC family transcriptional regulator [Candidatus Methanocrinis alkalitolerans]